MSGTSIAVLILVFSTVAQYLVTGQFMKILHRDDPSAYDEVANPVDLVANILGPLRFGLLYIIPRAYESWSLSPEGVRCAYWLRAVTFISLLAILGVLVQIVIELV